MDPKLEQLLAEVVKKHIAEVLYLLVNVALPLEVLFSGLAQDIQLDEVLVPCEEAESLE